MTKEEVLNLMKSSKSEQDWRDNCDIVKLAVSEGRISNPSGHYPDYWFNEIICTGMYHKLKANWTS
jgi:hypothetical protein